MANTSGFSCSTAAGVPTNLIQTNDGIFPTANSSTTESSSSVPQSHIQSAPNNIVGPALDRNHGKLGGEHGGAGTRTDDRKGETVPHEGDNASPTAKHTEP
jgi:hypothetical protein